jgi:hypothetical protein
VGDALFLVELRGFELPDPLACHRGIPTAAPTTKPRVAGHCTRAGGRFGDGSHGDVWVSCCAAAAPGPAWHAWTGCQAFQGGDNDLGPGRQPAVRPQHTGTLLWPLPCQGSTDPTCTDADPPGNRISPGQRPCPSQAVSADHCKVLALTNMTQAGVRRIRIPGASVPAGTASRSLSLP